MWQVPRRLIKSMPPRRQQPICPAPSAFVVPLVLDHCTSAPTPHPSFHSPANAARAYYNNVSDAPAHTHTASHLVLTRLCFPIPLWFRPDGIQMNFVRGFLFGTFP